MSAGLFRLGHDFGNGESDGHFFQRDELAPLYRQEKERILAANPRRLLALNDPETQPFQVQALAWMSRQLDSEHRLDPEITAIGFSHGETATPSNTLDHFRRLSLLVQEDFTLLQESNDEREKLILLSVCFPSSWKPELMLGANFGQLHAKVPEFDALGTSSNQLVQAMIHRGPYVRFVWSLSADARLDHHPVEAARDPWTVDGSGYLRVERQVTVPFPDFRGSLFLIRTYVYALEEISLEQRDILYEVTEALPDSIKSYKGLGPETRTVLARAARRAPT